MKLSNACCLLQSESWIWNGCQKHRRSILLRAKGHLATVHKRLQAGWWFGLQSTWQRSFFFKEVDHIPDVKHHQTSLKNIVKPMWNHQPTWLQAPCCAHPCCACTAHHMLFTGSEFRRQLLSQAGMTTIFLGWSGLILNISEQRSSLWKEQKSKEIPAWKSGKTWNSLGVPGWCLTLEKTKSHYIYIY